MRILVVDDDERVRETLSIFLREEGNMCDLAHDGTEGFRKVLESAYDVVLMDINMPNMDGVECIKAIRVVDPGVPIIIVTGTVSEERISEGLSSGANKVLKKPFDFSLITGHIKEVCGKTA